MPSKGSNICGGFSLKKKEKKNWYHDQVVSGEVISVNGSGGSREFDCIT